MPIPREYRDICQMLTEATNDGRVSWIDEEAAFVVRLPDFILEMWSGTDEQDGSSFIAMALKDAKRRGLDDVWYSEEGDEDFALVQSLYNSARRQARHVPAKLELLRGLLKSGKKVGLDADDNPT